MGNGLSLKSNWLRFSCLKHCLGQALSCPRPSMVMNDDALASPTLGRRSATGGVPTQSVGTMEKLKSVCLNRAFGLLALGNLKQQP
jgi:hypothetical protein